MQGFLMFLHTMAYRASLELNSSHWPIWDIIYSFCKIECLGIHSLRLY